MLSRWAGSGVLAWMLGGFCLPLSANTTVNLLSPVADAAHAPYRQPAPLQIAQTDLSIPRDPPPLPAPKPLQIALFLPISSDIFRQAADAVRAGMQAAHEHEPDGVAIQLVDSGDVAQEVVERYRIVAGQADLVVGPLSRSAVAALAQSGNISRPTIALTAPDTQPEASAPLPSRMLVMGLAIEDEARQIADWAGRDNAGKKAVLLHAGASWQRRAVKAFEVQWLKQQKQQKQQSELQTVELASSDGFVNGRTLLQLKKELADVPAFIFAALDAQQARQVRAVMGPQMPLYGTSQLNPVPFSGRDTAERMSDMDGIRLLDIPWQIDPEHPAVAIYARPTAAADLPRTADMERLYALGIDAYRVAREVAAQQSEFELDGVTGRLTVQVSSQQARLQRSAERAVYRSGSVVPLEAQR
ncbi:penicillin-binding protein activator [Noviherbaspirillum aerium]|uniref:penicillin-binding protein activator n=1 Tax=Noviherbaspirillum aerium TaxID=2588497 RepID=UPI00178C6172|nr:penicillin-binding protein activator [Noviherbaspirillum aerium]